MAMTFDPNAAAGPDSGIYGLPHSPDQAKVVVVPVPFEATCSYGGGAADGPAAVLRASRQVDLFDVETGRPYEDGIAMLPEPGDVRAWSDEGRQLAQPIIAAGGAKPGDRNLERVDSLCAWMNAWVYATCANRLGEGKLVATVGGDHSCSFGAIRAHAEKFPGLGVLHLDAHADLRDAYEGFTWSHASIMFNVVQQLPGVAKLVQVGIRDVGEAEAELIDTRDDRIHTFYDAEVARQRLDGTPWNRLVDRMVEKLPPHVYLSFDIDGLDPTLCPHTGTPVPGGLSFHEAVSLVAGVARSGRKIVGLDLMEVAPGPDGDEWDGNVAARLLYKMIGYALKSQRG
ncbi:MAG TPA: agmatinase family protein [Myxococcaceae bacterium]|nr:agmatinase family protein [Myxococcaceae bacterium]